MDDTTAEKREEAIAGLNAALADLESGDGLSRFLGGHGFMSRRFEFEWNDAQLEIDFSLPYARVLSGEESQKDDDAEIGAAIRMAILLLTVDGRKTDCADWMSVSVWADESGAGYSIRDAQGELVDSGDDWSGLIHRLESALGESEEELAVIWP
ncbi:MAG: hypothetical protein J6W80_00740 [Kiritimatiellae bacterium]|nr:hypothetical protein [Kiritimatiellia bacterium]